jgi:hypothetical protein
MFRTVRYTYEKVWIKAVKRWTDASGKKRQKTREFSQTLNPYNKKADGSVKTRRDIMDEIEAQRKEWLAAPCETELSSADNGRRADLLCGVFDNAKTMRRERYTDGILTSSLPCDEKMRTNKFFPWGCFGDLPPN